VFITTTNHLHILTSHSEETSVDISGDINPGKMADMHRAVGIRESSGDKSSFEFLLHIIYSVDSRFLFRIKSNRRISQAKSPFIAQNYKISQTYSTTKRKIRPIIHPSPAIIIHKDSNYFTVAAE
jgi:hypothetical protein